MQLAILYLFANDAALAHAEGVRRGEEARGLVEMAAWQRTEESLKRKQEPKPTSKCNINIAAVELCLRDHGQHTEKQIVQLCKIAAELQTKPTDVTNVCLRFEGTLRSFGRCREDDIRTLLALIKPEPSAKRRKLTCTKPQLECHQRAAVVWLSLHLDVKIAKVVQMFDAIVDRSTAQKWLTQPQAVCVWLPLAEKMTFSDVCAALASYRPQLHQLRTKIENGARLKPEALQPYLHMRGETAIVSKYNATPKDQGTGLSSGKRRFSMDNQSHGRKKRSQTRINFLHISTTRKNVRTEFLASSKWPTQAEWMDRHIQERWDAGRPVTLGELEVTLQKRFPKGHRDGRCNPSHGDDDFFTNHFSEDDKNARCKYANWRKRAFDAFGWSALRKTVSQKIPDNWYDLAVAFTMDTRERFKAFGVEELVAADQTFVNFHPDANDHVVAPTGTKRVGSTVEVDEKAGCSLMVTQELRTGEVDIPFWVMTGTTCMCTTPEAHAEAARLPATTTLPGGKKVRTPGYCGCKLDRIGGTYRSMQASKVNFQHKHWFDWVIMIRYLEYIKERYHRGTRKVGLIIDRAPTHEGKQVTEWVDKNSDWLITAFIPGGLTSVLQVGDLCCNADIKIALKAWYSRWKANELATHSIGHTKLKLPRDELIKAVEAIFKKFNATQRANPVVKKTFTKVGQDIFNDDLTEFRKWIDSLSEKSLYKSLIEAHTAAQLEDGDGFLLQLHEALDSL